ncbi:Na+/H+ antiporter subunit E [Mycolicibacterium moriokaense]|nr:Na+/H+ antiporter subunit E [Mycolicibacterium moriokaense]
MRRHVLRVWMLCWLVLVWVLLWGKVSAANIVGGLLVALVITVLLPLPAVPVEGRVHPLSLAKLIVVVGYQLVISSLQVAWLAIKPGPPPLTAVLRAHLAIKSDLVLALAVNIFNLIPGSVVLEIDQERRVIYAHVLDVGNAKSVDRFYRQIAQMERLLVAAFERETEFRYAASRTSGTGIPFREESAEEGGEQ